MIVVFNDVEQIETLILPCWCISPDSNRLMKILGNDLRSGGGIRPCLVDFAGIPIPVLFDIAQQRWKHLQPGFFVNCADDEWRDYKEIVFGQWSTMRQKSWQYLAGMASSMATIVSIGTLSALYVWAHHGTILSETSSLIETVIRKMEILKYEILRRWLLNMCCQDDVC